MKLQKHFIFFLTLFSICEIQAQISFGIKTGYTRARQDYGNITLPENAEVHVEGFHIATSSYFQFHKYFRVGLEPGYVERGAACFPGWGGRPEFVGDTKLLLKYVELPIMISGVLPLFKNKLEASAKIGYGLSFIVKGFQEEEQSDFPGTEVSTTKTKINFNEFPNLNRWDNGVYGGLGLGYNFGRSQLFLEFDYYWGLKNVDKENTSKNRVYDLSLGYMFRL